MLRFIIILNTLFLLNSSILLADQELITDDGREIILKDNGAWQLLSNDRFANTADGQRVRLKEDGSWSYIGNAPLKSAEQVRTTDLNIKLQKIVIETYSKKAQKNTRVKTQTVFHIKLKYSAQAKSNITLSNDDITFIKVKDNNGKRYTVLSVNATSTVIKPGDALSIIVRAEKSPALWDDVKSMDIVFDKGILGLQKPIALSQRTIDFTNKKVDGFK